LNLTPELQLQLELLQVPAYLDPKCITKEKPAAQNFDSR
jgi:hypothetical protein